MPDLMIGEAVLVADRPFAERPFATAAVTRGVRRALAALGQVSVVEFPLVNGRRADVFAVDPKGLITIVEVKSSVADFRTDRKWQDYGEFCDRFYFAVDQNFPADLIPEECGLIIADAYDAVMLRHPADTPLAAARRKAVMLRFGFMAAARLHRVEDPSMP